MGLTMSQRKAVTKTIATRYVRADKAGKGAFWTSCALLPVGTAATPARH